MTGPGARVPDCRTGAIRRSCRARVIGPRRLKPNVPKSRWDFRGLNPDSPPALSSHSAEFNLCLCKLAWYGLIGVIGSVERVEDVTKIKQAN